MATYVRKKCSKCNNTIESWHSDGEYIRIANPILKCQKCGTILVDKKKKEYIMFKPFDYFKYFITKILRNFIISLVLSAPVLIIDESILFFLVCFILNIIFLLNEIRKYNIEKIESIKRTNDYEYLDLLCECNCITEKEMYDVINLYNVKNK